MNKREVLKRISWGEKCYIPKLKRFILPEDIKDENARTWVYGTSDDGKNLRIDIRDLKPAAQRNVNEPTPFSKEKEEQLKEREDEVFEALRLLGQNKKYILQVFRDAFQSAMYRTMMTKVSHSKKKPFKDGEVSEATVRLMHYANSALIAGKIAEGLFPNDEKIKEGIELSTLLHDIGQTPVGHDGESACNDASESYNGGPFPHGSEGARVLKHRYYNKLKDALIKGAIIEEEARKRIDRNENNTKSYKERLKDMVNELNQNIEIGLEPELERKIRENEKNVGQLADRSIEILIMSAGNHNGERARENIKPDYSITFNEFWENIRKSYTKEAATLTPCTIADAIAKLSDQISSIPFDMIDGIRSGIEDEIHEMWAIPVSQILHIPLVAAKTRLKGNEKELKTLALEIQDSIIDNVIECSNSRELNMSLAEWLYGLEGKIGLRSPNIEEHIHFTTLPDEDFLLDNMVSDLTDRLVKEIVDEKGILKQDLNYIFRVPANSSNRTYLEDKLMEEYKGDDNLRGFYKYCTEVSEEEYNFHKNLVKGQELEFFRDKINEALQSVQRGDYEYLRKYGRNRQSTEYAIGLALEHEEFQLIQPDQDGEYSDKQIMRIIDNINEFYKRHPEFGINEYLQVSATKTIYDNEGEFSRTRRISRDQQIAARIAISYIMTLNDYELLDLSNNLGIITDEQKALFYRPYETHSEKRNGGIPIITSAAAKTQVDYQETTK